MNAQVEARQQAQLAFVSSGKDLVVGDINACPLPPEELAALTPDSPYLVELFGGRPDCTGFAPVYRRYPLYTQAEASRVIGA